VDLVLAFADFLSKTTHQTHRTLCLIKRSSKQNNKLYVYISRIDNGHETKQKHHHHHPGEKEPKLGFIFECR